MTSATEIDRLGAVLSSPEDIVGVSPVEFDLLKNGSPIGATLSFPLLSGSRVVIGGQRRVAHVDFPAAALAVDDVLSLKAKGDMAADQGLFASARARQRTAAALIPGQSFQFSCLINRNTSSPSYLADPGIALPNVATPPFPAYPILAQQTISSLGVNLGSFFGFFFPPGTAITFQLLKNAMAIGSPVVFSGALAPGDTPLISSFLPVVFNAGDRLSLQVVLNGPLLLQTSTLLASATAR
jgi:hypothetical protein